MHLGDGPCFYKLCMKYFLEIYISFKDILKYSAFMIRILRELDDSYLMLGMDID